MYFLKFTGQNNKLEDHGRRRYENLIIDVVDMPWSYVSNNLLRMLCHFHLSSAINSKVNLKGKKIWYKYVLSQIPVSEGSCLIINAHLYAFADKYLVNYVHVKFPKCKLVFYFSDKVEYFTSHYSFPKIEKIKKMYDLVMTYNILDAQKYGLDVIRPLVPDYSKVLDPENAQYCDVFFVGQNKGRLQQIHSVYNRCKNLGLQCEFYISGVSNEEEHIDGIHYNYWLKYDEVLSIVRRSKCVLNIVQENSSGITMRDYEALGMGKILLTNNHVIAQTELFDEGQVIWIENLEEKINLIKLGQFQSDNPCQKYNEEEWYRWLQLKLKYSKK